MPEKKVAIMGSGNWGSVIAAIVGANVYRYDCFHTEVYMYVHEETVNDEKLSELINRKHENVKYLPGVKLPKNVIAVPDALKTAENADIIIWVLPHQFVEVTCKKLIGKIKTKAICLSLIKGFYLKDGKVILISDLLRNTLNTEVCVMMGANIAREVISGDFCESTIGCPKPKMGRLLKRLLQTDNFRISVVDDIETIEICGSLKNIVALGAGFVDGLDYGGNTKAAIIRLGLMEMVSYVKHFCSVCNLEIFFESCGVADLITTCYGGRNRMVAEAFVTSRKSIVVLEKELLGGQQLQGPQTAAEVYSVIKSQSLTKKFPLFTAIHLICIGELPPEKMIDAVRNHPDYAKPSKKSTTSRRCFPCC